jgi:hypothetical protein
MLVNLTPAFENWWIATLEAKQGEHFLLTSDIIRQIFPIRLLLKNSPFLFLYHVIHLTQCKYRLNGESSIQGEGDGTTCAVVKQLRACLFHKQNRIFS